MSIQYKKAIKEILRGGKKVEKRFMSDNRVDYGKIIIYMKNGEISTSSIYDSLTDWTHYHQRIRKYANTIGKDSQFNFMNRREKFYYYFSVNRIRDLSLQPKEEVISHWY